MNYRKLTFVFIVVFLSGSIEPTIQASQDNLQLFDRLHNVDGQLVSRRGIIGQIMQLLDGVVAVTEDVFDVLLSPIKQLIKIEQEAIFNNPHKNDVATVRLGGPLSEGELSFREKRFAIVKAAQEKFLGMPLDDEDVLEIAFSGSGGGVRAKTCTLGFCVGADKIGLLDTVMCISGLSGSTWFLGPWISSGLPISEYKERALCDIAQGLDIQKWSDLGVLFDSFWVKFAYDQHLNIIDLYGALLGNNLVRGFDEKQNMVYLSKQKEILADGIFPLPVYTAVLANRDMINHWFEFTPFEVGSRWLNAYIPAWSFGRSFEKGKSCSYAPEQPLGFILATCGSAFAASLQEIYEKSIKQMEKPSFLNGIPASDMLFDYLKSLVKKIVNNTDVGEIRVSSAQVHNYVYQMDLCSFCAHDTIELVDAGVNFNNPICATYRRPPYGHAPDVIFILDASSEIDLVELELARDYACNQNMPFPEISQSDPAQQAMTVYEDSADLDIPLIVYLPRIIDQNLLMQHMNNSELSILAHAIKDFDIDDAINLGFAGTFNFNYTRAQAEQLMSVTEFNIRALKGEIKEILKKRVAAKKNKRAAS